MTSKTYNLTRYDADPGKVFDWLRLSEHVSIDDNGDEIQHHLYTSTIFIGDTDTILNYVEVDFPEVEAGQDGN